MGADSPLYAGTAHVIEVNVGRLDKRRMSGQYNALAGDLICGIAEVDVYAVLTSEGKLGIDVLSRAGVLGLLNDYAGPRSCPAFTLEIRKTMSTA